MKFKKKTLFFFVVLFILQFFTFTKISLSNQAAFQGFGSSATGGGLEEIIAVSSLDDSGPGTLRDALSSGKRNIKFSVGGTVVLKSELLIPSDVTIDGLSAPNPGINIVNDRVTIKNESNIIIQGIRFRGPAYDTLRIWYGASDIVVDHCSFSGSVDGGLDITEGAHNVTVSNCILANTAGDGKAMLIKYGAYHISLLNNVFLSNNQRNPQIGGSGPEYFKENINYEQPTVDMRYNIIGNWGGYGTLVTNYDDAVWPVSANIIGNTYFSQSHPQNALIVKKNGAADIKIFAKNNVSLDNISATKQYLSDKIVKNINEDSNHDEFPVTYAVKGESAEEAASQTVLSAGVRPLDQLDQSVISSINNQSAPGKTQDKPTPAISQWKKTIDVANGDNKNWILIISALVALFLGILFLIKYINKKSMEQNQNQNQGPGQGQNQKTILLGMLIIVGGSLMAWIAYLAIGQKNMATNKISNPLPIQTNQSNGSNGSTNDEKGTGVNPFLPSGSSAVERDPEKDNALIVDLVTKYQKAVDSFKKDNGQLPKTDPSDGDPWDCLDQDGLCWTNSHEKLGRSQDVISGLGKYMSGLPSIIAKCSKDNYEIPAINTKGEGVGAFTRIDYVVEGDNVSCPLGSKADKPSPAGCTYCRVMISG